MVTNFSKNPIISFSLGTNGEAFLLTINGFTAYLYSLQLFSSNETQTICDTSLIQFFDLSTITQKQIRPDSVKGKAIAKNYNVYYLLIDSVGLIEFDILSGNCSIAVSPRQNYTMISLASNVDRNSSLYINELSNSTSPKSIIYKFNITSSEYTNVLALPYYINGPIAYDYVSDNIFINSNIYVYMYSIGQDQFISNITLNNPWIEYAYYTNDPPYCPNGCSNNGKCGTNNVCSCSSGWTNSDCSQCNSLVYCNGHGICQLGTNYSRSCECIPGWQEPLCMSCDSSYLCNGNGFCNNQEGGQCACKDGFYGSSCQNCNSTFLCNSHGKCDSNTSVCTCDLYWGSSDCSQFNLDEDGVVETIFVLNIIVFSVWTLGFIIALLSTLFNHEISWLKIVTPTSILASLNYLQSFTLLTLNENISYLFVKYFKLYYLFNFDFYRGLSMSTYDFYVESSSWFPKTIAFLLVLIVWKMMKSTRIRGVLLQICLWFYLSFCISQFQRFQQCQSCSSTYNIISTLVAMCILGTFVYLFYRIWK